IHMPYQSALPATGDVDVGWLPLFDLAAPARRMVIPQAQASARASKQRPYEVHLGYVIDSSGRVDAIALGTDASCAAPLVEGVGAVRRLGTCLPDPTVGVEVGGKLILLTTQQDALVANAADVVPERASAFGAAAGKRGAEGTADDARHGVRGLHERF